MGPVRRVLVVGGGTAGDYSFNFPFGASSLVEAYAHDGTIENQSVTAMMMLLRRRPDLLEELVTSEGSWVNCGGERITGVDPVRGLLHPKWEGRRKRGPYARVLEAVDPPRVGRPSRQDRH